MMPWERKAVAAHVVLGFLLVGAVLKASAWVDATRLSSANHDAKDAYILRTLRSMPIVRHHRHRRVVQIVKVSDDVRCAEMVKKSS